MTERAIGQVRKGAQLAGDVTALYAAHAAMAAGCRFLIARADAGLADGIAIRPNVGLRRAGNCLNELDRFLSVLIAECARFAGIADAGIAEPAIGAADQDFPRRLDNARRLRRIEAHCGYDSRASTRLRAIGRIRLLAIGDGLQRPGAWLERDLAVATAGAATIVAHPAQCPQIADQALAAIAEFYWGLADRMYLALAKA
jgi:hypothetical protein